MKDHVRIRNIYEMCNILCLLVFKAHMYMYHHGGGDGCMEILAGTVCIIFSIGFG